MKICKRDARILLRLVLEIGEVILRPGLFVKGFLLIRLIVGIVLKIKMGSGSLSLNE